MDARIARRIICSHIPIFLYFVVARWPLSVSGNLILTSSRRKEYIKPFHTAGIFLGGLIRSFERLRGLDYSFTIRYFSYLRDISCDNMTKFKLNTGAYIPAIGFGTWQDPDSQEAAVHEAIKAGYRHIDTAHV